MFWDTRDDKVLYKVLIEPALKQYHLALFAISSTCYSGQCKSIALFWLIYAFRSETRKVGQRRGNLKPSTSKEAGDSLLLPLARAGQPDWPI